MVVCLIALVVLGYQWENWRSARELAAVRERIVQRLGSDDPLALLPAKVADEQNYFANPVIESWLKPRQSGSADFIYFPPPMALVPTGFLMPEIQDSVSDGDANTLALSLWALQRAEAGRPLSPGESADAVLARELGDGNGLLPKLATGLDKPFSTLKPGMREALETCGGNPWNAPFSDFNGMNSMQRQLGLHLRSAARSGNAAKTIDTALIMLRFGEAPADHGLIGGLKSVAVNGIAMEALHEAMNHEAWNADSLARLQVRLSKFNDLEGIERGLDQELLGTFQALGYLRHHHEELRGTMSQPGRNQSFTERLANEAVCCLMTYGPIGWHDANVAFYANCMMDYTGPRQPDAWLTAHERYEAAKRRCDELKGSLNPRRMLAALAVPNLGNLAEASARTLFKRRCLIIACALEQHRLRHGAFPASLDEVRAELQPFNVSDPARPRLLPGYRQENGGYLLWSAGPDARDDGGADGKDWLWRRSSSTGSKKNME